MFGCIYKKNFSYIFIKLNRFINQLIDNRPQITIVVSGSQIIPDDRSLITESWYSKSKQLLYNTILGIEKQGIIFISGDIHQGEILQLPCFCRKIGYPLIEITSSGLTHAVGQFRENSSFKKIQNFIESIFGQIDNLGAILTDVIFPPTFSQQIHRYQGKNFGTLRIVFDKQDIKESEIKLQINDEDGHVRIEKSIQLKQLIPKNDIECTKNVIHQQTNNCILNSNPIVRQLTHIIDKLFFKEYYKLGRIILIILVVITFMVYKLVKYFKKQLRQFVKNKQE